MHIKEVSLNEIIPLRHSILRKGKPVSSCYFEEDQHEGTFHLGAFVLSKLVGIATFIPHYDEGSKLLHFQLRGMAIEVTHQGKGVGRKIIKYVFPILVAKNGATLWCNARESAFAFYQKMGFEIMGNAFDIPSVGTHYKMQKQL